MKTQLKTQSEAHPHGEQWLEKGGKESCELDPKETRLQRLKGRPTKKRENPEKIPSRKTKGRQRAFDTKRA